MTHTQTREITIIVAITSYRSIFLVANIQMYIHLVNVHTNTVFSYASEAVIFVRPLSSCHSKRYRKRKSVYFRLMLQVFGSPEISCNGIVLYLHS
jgi:hypothetical protein